MEPMQLRLKVWQAREQLAAELGVPPTVKAILSRVPEARDTNTVRYHLAFAGRFYDPMHVASPERYLQPVAALTLCLGRRPRAIDIYDAGLADCPEIAALARRMALRYIPCPSSPEGKTSVLADRWRKMYSTDIPAETLAFVLECSVGQASEYLKQLAARGLHSATV